MVVSDGRYRGMPKVDGQNEIFQRGQGGQYGVARAVFESCGAVDFSGTLEEFCCRTLQWILL